MGFSTTLNAGKSFSDLDDFFAQTTLPIPNYSNPTKQ